MIAIIPARGGSKGLPGKNIREFDGRPLISITVTEALKVPEISRVIVSTDDIKIAEVAQEYGAEVPFMRPAELASDESPALEAYFYTIDRLREEENIEYKDFIVLFPTAPLRRALHLSEAIQLFYEKRADSVISVSESLVPIEWTRNINEEGKLVPFFSDGNKNRQDYKITYIPNGQIYIFNVDRLKETRAYYMENTYPYITDKEYYGDIDDMDDFLLTEYKYKLNRKRGLYD